MLNSGSFGYGVYCAKAAILNEYVSVVCMLVPLKVRLVCNNLIGYIEIMEKKKPHYALSAIQQVVAARRVSAFTATALVGAAQLGLSPDEAVEIVLGIKPNAFYKSMTTHADHMIWQDVYHVVLKSKRTTYVKVTLRENGIVVIQFKEK